MKREPGMAYDTKVLNKIFAVVLISMIPILLFYMFAQKKFIQGFGGGLKG